MGGWVTLEGSPRRISDVADLPAADFRIVVLNMVATNMHPPHMEAFGKLMALRELYLPGPMWNPRAESRTLTARTLAYLNGLSTLKKLEMSYTFLEGMSVLDVGFEKMQGLAPTLEEAGPPQSPFERYGIEGLHQPAGARPHYGSGYR